MPAENFQENVIPVKGESKQVETTSKRQASTKAAGGFLFARDDRDLNLALARPVELGEEDPLPAAQS